MLTPEEQHDLEILNAHFGGQNKAAPVITPTAPNVANTPTGQIKTFENAQDITKNLQTEANKTLDPTAASRKAMLENAQQNLNTVNKIMKNPDGSISNWDAFTASNNIPWTEGSQAANALQNALHAQLRAETGAGAPATEVQEMSKRFMPSIMDNEETKKQKLDNIQRLIDGTYTNMLPKLDQKNQKAAPKESPVIDYKEFFK